MSNTTKTANELIPAISLRGLVVFPAMVLHFDIGRERSVNAVKAAAEGNGRIFLVAQKDAAQTEPELSDIYEVGVIAEVRQLLTTPDGSTRVLVEGLTRAKRVKSVPGKEYLQFEVKELPVRGMELSESTAAAAVRSLKNTFAEYAQISPRMPRELFEGIMSEENCAELFEKVVFNVVLKVEDKQALLETNGLLRRVKMLISMLESEIEIIETEIDIQEQVKEQVDKNQREYYLREQLRAIYKQLGEGDNPQEEADGYIEKIRALNLSDEITEKLIGEAQKLVKMSYSSQEAGVIRGYLDTVLELPWNVKTKDKLDIEKVQKQLDKDHYGLKKVKERITEIISVRALAPDVKGQIICLYGPPGVGKTSIGKSIAEALGRNYVRISLGGVHDEAEIRGHRKTYIGAMPGRIAAALKQAKSMNPVMLLDEIDKMGSDYKGDPASAVSIEAVCHAVGIDRVRVVDPANLAETEAVIKEELAADAPSVIITRRPCALLKTVKHKPPVKVDPDKCRSCKACMRIGCPAISMSTGKAKIDNTLCVGCGLCTQMCKFDAIEE